DGHVTGVQTCALPIWNCIRNLAEGEGFEPPKACTLVVFKTTRLRDAAQKLHMMVRCKLNQATECTGQSHLIGCPTSGLQEFGARSEERRVGRGGWGER